MGLSAAKVMRPLGELNRSTMAGYGEAMVDWAWKTWRDGRDCGGFWP